jgi:hypothetical protein
MKSRMSALSIAQMRTFCTHYRKITPDVMKKLYWLENHYEQDPRNQKTAYKYFRELNRHGKHHTVVRLYNKYYDDYDANIKGSSIMRDKLRNQFEYAEDTIYSVKRAVEENDEEVILPDLGEREGKTRIYKVIDFA